MDFCQYPDTSLVSLLTIEYLLRTTSSQKQKPETKQPVSGIKKEDAEKGK
jgi:hypothetical protein